MTQSQPAASRSPSGRELEAELLSAWEANYGEPPGALHDDLRRLGELFGTRVSSERIGRAIRALPESPLGRTTSRLYPSLLLPAGQGVFVTVEGRIALELLRKDDGLPAEAAAERAGSDPVVIELYREWIIERVESLIATEEGRGDAMYPAAIGATLLLMLQEADSEDTALELPAPGTAVEEALMQPLRLLNGRIAKGRRKDLKTPLRAYPIKKAERRLGHRIVVRRPATGIWTAWVPSSESREVLSILADELVRRRGLSTSEALGAVDEFAQAYEAAWSQLRQLGRLQRRTPAWVLDELRQRIRHVGIQ